MTTGKKRTTTDNSKLDSTITKALLSSHSGRTTHAVISSGIDYTTVHERVYQQFYPKPSQSVGRRWLVGRPKEQIGTQIRIVIKTVDAGSRKISNIFEFRSPQTDVPELLENYIPRAHDVYPHIYTYYVQMLIYHSSHYKQILTRCKLMF